MRSSRCTADRSGKRRDGRSSRPPPSFEGETPDPSTSQPRRTPACREPEDSTQNTVTTCRAAAWTIALHYRERERSTADYTKRWSARMRICTCVGVSASVCEGAREGQKHDNIEAASHPHQSIDTAVLRVVLQLSDPHVHATLQRTVVRPPLAHTALVQQSGRRRAEQLAAPSAQDTTQREGARFQHHARESVWGFQCLRARMCGRLRVRIAATTAPVPYHRPPHGQQLHPHRHASASDTACTQAHTDVPAGQRSHAAVLQMLRHVLEHDHESAAAMQSGDGDVITRGRLVAVQDSTTACGWHHLHARCEHRDRGVCVS
jgi:hypothetical protein